MLAAVGALSAQAEEQIPCGGLAGVDQRPARASGATLAHDRRIRGRGDPFRLELDHGPALAGAASRRSSSRATSRSSNGTLRPASNSWPCSCPLPAITTVSPPAAASSASAIAARRSGSTSISAAALRDPGADLGDDRERVLGARVVGRDHREVGESGGDLAHQRPLLAVAIAAAPEHADQPPAGHLPGGVEDVLERVGGVGVVDDDRERLALVDRLEAARDAIGDGERRDHVGEREPERPGAGDRAKRVLDVEPARQRQRHLCLAVRRQAAEARARGAERRLERAVGGALVAAGREGQRFELGRQAVAVGVVEVDHGALRAPGVEQAPLGEEVVAHVGVEVEVVLGQVGERGDREADPIRAAQSQRMRGDLHRAGAVAALDHAAKGRLQVDCLGRRALDLLLDAADHALHRSQQAGLDRGALEDLTDEERGRRLPVRARDPDHAQLRGRVVVETDRRVRHRRPAVGDHGLHDPGLELEPALDRDRDRTRLNGERREPVPVGDRARVAEEQGSVADPPAVVGEAGDLDLGVADDLDHVGACEQLAKLHAGDSRKGPRRPAAQRSGSVRRDPQVRQRVARDLAERRSRHGAAVVVALRVVDDHRDQQTRVLGGGEADE